MIRFVSQAKVDGFVAIRPPGYLEELAPAIVERTAAGIRIDDQHPAYLAAWRKYRLGPVAAEAERIAEICRGHVDEDGQRPWCLFYRMQPCGRRKMIEKRTAFCPDERWELQPEGTDDAEG